MSQIEYMGNGAINRLEDILGNLHVSKAFLVRGRKSFIACGAEVHIKKIKNIQFVQFFDFGNNINVEDANKGLKLFQQSNAEVIIALGGGSAIDMAKLIHYYSERSLNEISIADINSINISCNKQIPLIAIPTTAGSGSEATSFAVVYANKVKYSVTDNSILPTVAIIDPTLSMSLSPYDTAVTGMDALCHAIEAYWSNNSTDESKEYSEKAIIIILNSLEKDVHDPSIELRSNMAEAANLAGKAINISKTTAAHALSYTLTSYFSIPHGLAVSLLLPDLLVYNFDVTESDANDPRGVSYIQKSINKINYLLGGKDSHDTRFILNQFISKLGLSTDMSFYGVKYSDIDLILDNINIERLNNNPRRIKKDKIREMLELRLNIKEGINALKCNKNS